MGIAQKGNENGSHVFRVIPIPQQEHGYGNFESVVIRSDQDVNEFFSRTSVIAGMAWNEKGKFEEAIRQSCLDFTKESLVLIRHTEESGSVELSFRVQRFESPILHCSIRRKEPAGMGTTDMVHYCFGLAVFKQEVRKIRLLVGELYSFELDI